ncbi:MAG: DMT family transporter [Pseudomonadota bacterium]
MTLATANPAERPVLGIGLRIFSGLLFAAMVVCIKAVSLDVPLGQVVFFRSFFALIPLVIFLWLRKEFPTGLRTKRPLGHFARSGFGALAMFASFASIARLPVAEASLIGHLTPVFTALAAVVFLSERLTLWRVCGVALGLAGVVVLVWPELGQGEPDARRLAGYGYGLAMAILTAFALIMVRSLNRTESPGAIAFYFVVVSMIGGILTLPWGWVLPNATTLALLVLSGLFGGMAHIAMTLAFRNAEASRLAPFEYVALIWPIFADLLIFRILIAPAFVFALPLVLGGAALAALEGFPSRKRSV